MISESGERRPGSAPRLADEPVVHVIAGVGGQAAPRTNVADCDANVANRHADVADCPCNFRRTDVLSPHSSVNLQRLSTPSTLASPPLLFLRNNSALLLPLHKVRRQRVANRRIDATVYASIQEGKLDLVVCAGDASLDNAVHPVLLGESFRDGRLTRPPPPSFSHRCSRRPVQNARP